MHSALFAVAMTNMFGQVPMPVKAGDRAPSLDWTQIVASGSPLGGPQSLLGHTTVLLFLRPVSGNEQALSRWNKLVQQFAGKPVNFIWIANEQHTSLAPFLKTHHVAGWMVLDSREESYRAYGVEGAAGVLIDSLGTIAGFTFITPEEEQIQAVLDGRAIAIQGNPTESNWMTFSKRKRFELKLSRLGLRPRRGNRIFRRLTKFIFPQARRKERSAPAGPIIGCGSASTCELFFRKYPAQTRAASSCPRRSIMERGTTSS